MFCIRPIVVRHRSCSFLRHLRNRKVDSVIGAASAKISAEAPTDFFRTCIGMLIEKCLERHYEAGGAEAALRSIVIDERLLDRMKGFALHQGFDGSDGLALSFNRQYRAGIDRTVVEQHSTGATLSPIAHALRARNIKLIAEGVKQGDARLELQCVFLAVDAEFDGSFARTIN